MKCGDRVVSLNGKVTGTIATPGSWRKGEFTDIITPEIQLIDVVGDVVSSGLFRRKDFVKA